jgi:hypothetical protein
LQKFQEGSLLFHPFCAGSVSQLKTGFFSAPTTSDFSITGNFTPKLTAQNSAISLLALGSCSPKLLAGKASTMSFIGIFILQLLQLGILRRVAALACRVGYQQVFSAKSIEVHCLTHVGICFEGVYGFCRGSIRFIQ